MTKRSKSSCRGMSRAVAILLVLVAVMALIVAIPPTWRYFKSRSSEIACVQSLDSATRQISVDFLYQYYADDEQTAEEVKAEAARAMLGWEDICPAGGTVYVVRNPSEDEGLPYLLVCGLHNKDSKLCTRLNADYVLDQLRDTLYKEKTLGHDLPENVEASLHHQPLTVVRLSEPNDLKRGTGSTIGHKGTEVYYTRDDDGTVNWFVFADEKHAAVWTPSNGWSGDSYS